MTSPAAANPFRQALLDTAVAMLEERGSEGFKVDEVLIESGTSSSSLYHHFGSREGLLDAAQQERYRRLARSEDRRHLEGGFTAATPEEFLDYLAAQLRRMVTDPANRAARRGRLEAATRALGSPELAAQTAVVQENMFGVIAGMYRSAQERGLINSEVDLRAYVLWVHGMVLGWTAIEAGPVDTEAWLAVAIPAVLAPLRLSTSTSD